MTIHGAPFSPHSISPPCCEIMLPPYTHTHTHKRGWAKACTRSAHCCSSSISTFQKSSCFLLSQRPGSFSYLHLTTGREQQREAQKTPWLSLPHPLDFPLLSTDLCLRSPKSLRKSLWSHLRLEKIQECSVSQYPALDVWSSKYCPTWISFFFSSLNGKWSNYVNWDGGGQVKLDCCRTSLSKQKRVNMKRGNCYIVCRTKVFFFFFIWSLSFKWITLGWWEDLSLGRCCLGCHIHHSECRCGIVLSQCKHMPSELFTSLLTANNRLFQEACLSWTLKIWRERLDPVQMKDQLYLVLYEWKCTLS